MPLRLASTATGPTSRERREREKREKEAPSHGAKSTRSRALYELDKSTGAARSPITTGPTVLRVVYDPTRDVVFTAVGSGSEPSVSARSIGTLNRTTGANTSLGTVLANREHTGHHSNGFLSAPRPVCP